MQIKYIKMHFVRQHPEVVEQKREDFQRKNLTKALLQYLDSKNYFEGKKDIFTYEVIETGKLPPNYSVHHILPIYGGGGNELDNLAIVDEKLHIFLHTCFFVPKDKKFLYGKDVVVKVPDLGPVARYADYVELIKKHMAEIQKKKLRKEKKKLEYNHKIIYEEMHRPAQNLLEKNAKCLSDEESEIINTLLEGVKE